MVVKQEKTKTCRRCKQKFTVREYEGLSGAWYTDHFAHCRRVNQRLTQQKGKKK